MRQTRPALLALVVVVLLAAPATTIAIAAPSAGENATTVATNASDRTMSVIRSQSNSSNFLDIEQEDVERGEYGEASLDVAAAVSMETARLRGTYESYAFDAGYENSSGANRTARLTAEMDRLEQRVRRLEGRQAQAITAYNAGDLTTERFASELAAIDVAARSLQRQFDHIQNRPDILLTSEQENRLLALEADLIPLRGQARGNVGAALSGERSETAVYALTSRRGLVLSVSDGNRLVREASLPVNRDRGATDKFATEDDPTGVSTANDRARELYPWTYANSPPSIERVGQTSVYSVSLDHPQGTLDTFLDGATRNVFHEEQLVRMDRLPTRPVANTTTSVVLQVNRTYGTGPMKVRTTDPVTAEPVDAIVVVNGERVGRTGDDGQLWTLTPHQAVRIEVRSANGSAELSFFAG